MMKTAPRAKLINSTPARTVWEIRWPTGKTYFATTYPNSDLLFIETGANRRPVSALQGQKLHSIIRRAIAKGE